MQHEHEPFNKFIIQKIPSVPVKHEKLLISMLPGADRKIFNDLIFISIKCH